MLNVNLSLSTSKEKRPSVGDIYIRDRLDILLVWCDIHSDRWCGGLAMPGADACGQYSLVPLSLGLSNQRNSIWEQRIHLPCLLLFHWIMNRSGYGFKDLSITSIKLPVIWPDTIYLHWLCLLWDTLMLNKIYDAIWCHTDLNWISHVYIVFCNIPSTICRCNI